MKVKTSITLPQDLLKRIDLAYENRSTFLERAALHYLSELEQARRDGRDAAILEAQSEYLNREAADVLEYQDLP